MFNVFVISFNSILQNTCNNITHLKYHRNLLFHKLNKTLSDSFINILSHYTFGFLPLTKNTIDITDNGNIGHIFRF